MKKIRGKVKTKKKATNGKRRATRTANTSYAALDDRLTSLEDRVRDLAMGLARDLAAPTTEPPAEA